MGRGSFDPLPIREFPRNFRMGIHTNSLNFLLSHLTLPHWGIPWEFPNGDSEKKLNFLFEPAASLQPASQPAASWPASKLASKPVSKPASQPAASQTASLGGRECGRLEMGVRGAKPPAQKKFKLLFSCLNNAWAFCESSIFNITALPQKACISKTFG